VDCAVPESHAPQKRQLELNQDRFDDEVKRLREDIEDLSADLHCTDDALSGVERRLDAMEKDAYCSCEDVGGEVRELVRVTRMELERSLHRIADLERMVRCTLLIIFRMGGDPSREARELLMDTE
jgi:predicted RNase H-like nuclease (RuvC/YqgF family)